MNRYTKELLHLQSTENPIFSNRKINYRLSKIYSAHDKKHSQSAYFKGALRVLGAKRLQLDKPKSNRFSPRNWSLPSAKYTRSKCGRCYKVIEKTLFATFPIFKYLYERDKKFVTMHFRENFQHLTSPSLTKKGKSVNARLSFTNDDSRHVYFLKAINEPIIKIGVSVDPVQRSDQIDVPNRLHCVLEGAGYAFEAKLHRQLRHLHVTNRVDLGNEWFLFTDEITDLLYQLKKKHENLVHFC